MPKIINVISVAIVITVVGAVFSAANAGSPGEQKPSPTPTAKRQETTKSHPKDLKAIGTPTPTPTARPKDQAKGWDGKVQGKQLKKAPSVTPTPTPQKSR